MSKKLMFLKYCSYGEALAHQEELNLNGGHGWFLFACPPTITLGRRAKESDILVSAQHLKKMGIEISRLDRGGEVTYHGPGQILGFPYGPLQAHVGDPRGVRAFVKKLESRLSQFIDKELASMSEFERGERRLAESPCPPGSGAGVWICDGTATVRKIVSIGLGFDRQGIRHGFALNVQPLEAEFKLINPCGERDRRVASLFTKQKPFRSQEEVAGRLAESLASPAQSKTRH